jgi:hypothetical protein
MHAATRHTLAMMSLFAVAAGCSGTIDTDGAHEARASTR